MGWFLGPLLNPMTYPPAPPHRLAHHSAVLDRGLEGRHRGYADPQCSFPSMPHVCFMPSLPMDVYGETWPCPLSPALLAVSAAHKSSLTELTHRLRMRSFLRFTTSLSINLMFFVVFSEACWEDRRGEGRGTLLQVLQETLD